ncbi:hypothetical protein ACJMK2_023165 [Sinanodonta woodiana]|uniref:Transcobalamin-like C-terminal domain-containing protein n=1 Tax=Sinanodonta woodiana TaxID=1069815 RepID=A0ABD3T3B8_SINWO
MNPKVECVCIIIFFAVACSAAQNEPSSGEVEVDTKDFACRRQLNYTIRNNLQEPTFEYSIAIRFCRQPFIRIMETAVNKNRNFMFSATYFPKLGYFIDAINGVRGFYNVNKTWWAFLKAPDTMLPVGVSSYYPANRDHIIFNFTQEDYS